MSSDLISRLKQLANDLDDADPGDSDDYSDGYVSGQRDAAYRLRALLAEQSASPESNG